MENPLYRSKSYFSGRNVAEKKKHCLSKCLSSAVSHLRSSPFLCSPLILHRAHEANGGRIYALESGMYALAFASTQVPASTRFASSFTSANMVTSLLTPLKSKNSSTQTLKNLNLSSTKTIKAQHSTLPVFFFPILGISPSGPLCTFCGARVASSLKLGEPSLAPLLVFYSNVATSYIGGVKYLASLSNLAVEVFG